MRPVRLSARWLIKLYDPGCPTVGVIAAVRLVTALCLPLLPVTRTHWLGSSAAFVSGRQWRSHLTSDFPLLLPRIEYWS